MNPSCDNLGVCPVFRGVCMARVCYHTYISMTDGQLSISDDTAPSLPDLPDSFALLQQVSAHLTSVRLVPLQLVQTVSRHDGTRLQRKHGQTIMKKTNI